MNGRFLKRLAVLLALAALVMTTVAPAATMAAKPAARGKPEIHTNRDKAKEKIHPRLLAQVEPGRTRTCTSSRRSSAIRPPRRRS